MREKIPVSNKATGANMGNMTYTKAFQELIPALDAKLNEIREAFLSSIPGSLATSPETSEDEECSRGCLLRGSTGEAYVIDLAITDREVREDANPSVEKPELGVMFTMVDAIEVCELFKWIPYNHSEQAFTNDIDEVKTRIANVPVSDILNKINSHANRYNDIPVENAKPRATKPRASGPGF